MHALEFDPENNRFMAACYEQVPDQLVELSRSELKKSLMNFFCIQLEIEKDYDFDYALRAGGFLTGGVMLSQGEVEMVVLEWIAKHPQCNSVKTLNFFGFFLDCACRKQLQHDLFVLFLSGLKEAQRTKSRRDGILCGLLRIYLHASKELKSEIRQCTLSEWEQKSIGFPSLERAGYEALGCIFYERPEKSSNG